MKLSKLKDYDEVNLSINGNKENRNFHIVPNINGVCNKYLVDITKVEEHYMSFDIYENTNGFWEIDDKADITGSMKWDGCSNFNLSNNTMTHFCGVNDIYELALLLQVIYNYAESNIPRWNVCDGTKVDNISLLKLLHEL